jgi:agmatinase
MSAIPSHGFNTFMNVAYEPKPKSAKAAILGCPFDYGVHQTRIGARLGPRAIREMSALLRANDPETNVDVVERLGLVDCGDAAVTPSRVRESFEAIERAMHPILEAGATPVTMGGDGMVSLPQMRAYAKHHGTFAVIHIDAHTDAYPMQGFNPATTFIRAAGEGLIDTEASFHIGMRGPTVVSGVYDTGQELGFTLVTMKGLRAKGVAALAEEVKAKIGERPCYLCWDMDFFDPSVAPGVCTPEWGGATTREGFELLDALEGFNWIGFDCNTVSPPHDLTGATAHLAGVVMLKFLTKLALAEGS